MISELESSCLFELVGRGLETPGYRSVFRLVFGRCYFRSDLRLGYCNEKRGVYSPFAAEHGFPIHFVIVFAPYVIAEVDGHIPLFQSISFPTDLYTDYLALFYLSMQERKAYVYPTSIILILTINAIPNATQCMQSKIRSITDV